MKKKFQKISLPLVIIFLTFNLSSILQADEAPVQIQTPPTQQELLQPYLLPKNHSLNKQLAKLFTDPKMFRSPENLTQAGFTVKLGHRKLMVGFHPSIPKYLIKKFSDGRSQEKQISNYVKRIKGANLLRKVIKEHHFKRLKVPHKWLYQLPDIFSKNEPTYVLIVENMNIYDDWQNPEGEARKHYYNMDQETLTELCTILHEVGGCDAMPRNQPFTRSGKIAFVDTEHVGKLHKHFMKHIVPNLNQELQAYAAALWMKLEEDESY